MSRPSRPIQFRISAAFLLATLMVSAPLSRAQSGPDNPDPDGNYITKFEFTQAVSGDANDPARRLPGRDTYLLIPDRTGRINLYIDLTFTYSSLDVRLVDARGVDMGGFTGVSSCYGPS